MDIYQKCLYLLYFLIKDSLSHAQLEVLLVASQQVMEANRSIGCVSYQAQGEVEQRRAAVEQDGEERGAGGDEEAHVPAHHHPQRLQDLQNNNNNNNKAAVSMLSIPSSQTQLSVC